MGQEVNIQVTEVNLLNDKNKIQVEVLLGDIWEQVRLYPFIYVKAKVNIPVMEAGNDLFLVYEMQQEFQVSSIPELTKSVFLNGEFLGNVNLQKQVEGTSNVYGYHKESAGA